MSEKLFRSGVSLDPRYPSEKNAIALIRAVPARGERTAFLRSLILLGRSEMLKEQAKDGKHE